NWTVGDGRLYSQEELEAGKNLCVLGMGGVGKLFEHTDPLGTKIRIDGNEYMVAGVLERQGGMLRGDMGNFLAVPPTTFLNDYGKDRDIHIMVQSTSRDTYEDCIEQVRGILRSARQVPPGGDDDFFIFSNDSVIEQFNSFTQYVRLGIMLISAV